MRTLSGNRSRGWATALALLCALAGGCVQRRLTIRTNPPGALVYIDDYEIGTTPVSTDYIYYGTRNIRLIKDGFETLVVSQKLSPPWYELPGIDFLSENIWPGEIRDERTLNFNLLPQRIAPTGEVLSRANELRAGTRTGSVGPLPGTEPGGIFSPGRSAPGYLDPSFIPRGAASAGPGPGYPAIPPPVATGLPPAGP